MNNNTFKKTVLRYLEEHPPAYRLFLDLQEAGNLYMIGGALREYRDKSSIKVLRDVDIIVDVKHQSVWDRIIQTYHLYTNRFDGYKINCQDLLVDTWELQQTWAYRTGTVQCDPDQYVNHLSKTVFLNIDSIIYDWNNERWDDSIYGQAMQSKMLDIVLRANPQPELNIVRAFVLQKRYQMRFSDALKQFIVEVYQKKYMDLDDFVAELMNKQRSRYKEEVLPQKHYTDAILELLSEGHSGVAAEQNMYTSYK